MSFDVTKLLPFMKLWFMSSILSAMMLMLGITGGVPFLDSKLLNESNQLPAQITGWVLMIISLVLLYRPPTDPRRSKRHKHSISPTQLALFISIDDWTEFKATANKAKPPTMPNDEYLVRVQLAIHQGLLMHRIHNGQHEVKYRVNLNVRE